METNSIKNNKKAFYEKLWFWLVVLIGMFIIAGITESNKNVSTSSVNEISNSVYKKNTLNTIFSIENTTNNSIDNTINNINNSIETTKPSTDTSKDITKTKESTETIKQNNKATTTPSSTTTINANQGQTVKDTNSTTVYVTKTGKKYHKDGCSYLKNSKIEMTLENAKNSGYTPCSKCY